MQQVSSLQQQLGQNASQQAEHTSDLSRLQSKVEELQFDLGNLTHSLQVTACCCNLTSAAIVHMTSEALHKFLVC